MVDLISIFGGYSYLGIFVLQIVTNVVPILMPPSWIVLSSFYATYSGMNILLLAAVGATGSLIGRLVLMRISKVFRRFMGKRRVHGLDDLRKVIKSKKYGFLATSFLYSLSPFPSNTMFIAYGIMGAHNLGIAAGFWLGRMIVYSAALLFTTSVIRPVINFFGGDLQGILITDAVSMIAVVVFACIDWHTLVKKRKLAFIRPRFWRF